LVGLAPACLKKYLESFDGHTALLLGNILLTVCSTATQDVNNKIPIRII
jgi:hypothetical protein